MASSSLQSNLFLQNFSLVEPKLKTAFLIFHFIDLHITNISFDGI
jgi:hypothetical protein